MTKWQEKYSYFGQNRIGIDWGLYKTIMERSFLNSSALFHSITAGETIINGDVDGDGRVSLKDVYALYRMVAS